MCNCTLFECQPSDYNCQCRSLKSSLMCYHDNCGEFYKVQVSNSQNTCVFANHAMNQSIVAMNKSPIPTFTSLVLNPSIVAMNKSQSPTLTSLVLNPNSTWIQETSHSTLALDLGSGSTGMHVNILLLLLFICKF
jgi:hypothetical protein